METIEITGKNKISIDVSYVKKIRDGVSIVDNDGHIITIPKDVIKKINNAKIRSLNKDNNLKLLSCVIDGIDLKVSYTFKELMWSKINKI